MLYAILKTCNEAANKVLLSEARMFVTEPPQK
jgi:hypothetical protein